MYFTSTIAYLEQDMQKNLGSIPQESQGVIPKHTVRSKPWTTLSALIQRKKIKAQRSIKFTSKYLLFYHYIEYFFS